MKTYAPEPYSTLKDKKRQQALAAEQHCSKWLNAGNEAEEKGNHAKAEVCYDKAQYWMDRFNKLTGRSDG